MKFLSKWNEEDEEKNVASGAIQVFVILFVIIPALVYSEIMFLSIVSVAFPHGIIGNLAVVGALVTAVSCLCLYFGKKHWFLSGSPQFYAAVAFTVVEILIMVGNDVVAFLIQTHQDLGQLAIWMDITPASPLATIIGWFVVVYLDPGNLIKQKRMKAAQKKKELELDYEMTTITAQYGLQKDHLQQVTARLDDAMSAPSVQAKIEEHAQRMVAQVLTRATGINAFNASKDTKTVDSSASSISLAQTAEVKKDPQ